MIDLSKKLMLAIFLVVMWIIILLRALNDKDKVIQEGASLLAKVYIIFMFSAALVTCISTVMFPVWRE